MTVTLPTSERPPVIPYRLFVFECLLIYHIYFFCNWSVSLEVNTIPRDPQGFDSFVPLQPQWCRCILSACTDNGSPCLTPLCNSK